MRPYNDLEIFLSQIFSRFKCRDTEREREFLRVRKKNNMSSGDTPKKPSRKSKRLSIEHLRAIGLMQTPPKTTEYVRITL